MLKLVWKGTDENYENDWKMISDQVFHLQKRSPTGNDAGLQRQGPRPGKKSNPEELLCSC